MCSQSESWQSAEPGAAADGRRLVGFWDFKLTRAAAAAELGRSAAEGFLDVEPATIEEAVALLKERPDDAELHQHLGGLYFQRGDLMEAWQAYMQSLRLNPDDPWTCLKFGTLLTICDDKHYARELFDRAIELEPKLAVAHWCSANLHRKQGEYELAGRAYERAVEVDPDDEQARGKLAEWQAFIAEGGGPPLPSAPDAEPGAAADRGRM